MELRDETLDAREVAIEDDLLALWDSSVICIEDENMLWLIEAMDDVWLVKEKLEAVGSLSASDTRMIVE
jgi:hypothetical protein